MSGVTVLDHRRSTLHSIFQISISQNMKCAYIWTVFQNIVTYVLYVYPKFIINLYWISGGSLEIFFNHQAKVIADTIIKRVQWKYLWPIHQIVLHNILII